MLLLILLAIILFSYIGWINSSIREIKQKLSSIEELLKNNNTNLNF